MDNYERKVRKLKKAIKSLVVENSTLCDHIADIQNTIDVVKHEREFLLRKLIEHEPATVELAQQGGEIKQQKKRKNSSSDASSIGKPLGKKYKVQQMTIRKQAAPKLPLVIDGITLLSLGRIESERPAFRNDQCIYPVGYKISRTYNNKMFVLRIIDNGIGPLFEAFLANDPNKRFSGASTDDCHADILQAYNSGMPHVLDGDSFFGLKHKTIREFINQLPNARKIIRIKQEIKQENLTFFDDNARSYTINQM